MRESLPLCCPRLLRVQSKICKLCKAIFSVFYNISKPNHTILLVLRCSFSCACRFRFSSRYFAIILCKYQTFFTNKHPLRLELHAKLQEKLQGVDNAFIINRLAHRRNSCQVDQLSSIHVIISPGQTNVSAWTWAKTRGETLPFQSLYCRTKGSREVLNQ